jgi:hypothetical protein
VSGELHFLVASLLNEEHGTFKYESINDGDNVNSMLNVLTKVHLEHPRIRKRKPIHICMLVSTVFALMSIPELR